MRPASLLLLVSFVCVGVGDEQTPYEEKCNRLRSMTHEWEFSITFDPRLASENLDDLKSYFAAVNATSTNDTSGSAEQWIMDEYKALKEGKNALRDKLTLSMKKDDSIFSLLVMDPDRATEDKFLRISHASVFPVCKLMLRLKDLVAQNHSWTLPLTLCCIFLALVVAISVWFAIRKARKPPAAQQPNVQDSQYSCGI